MTNDEEIVQALLSDLAKKRADSESAVYDAFFKAPDDVREMFYQYWLKNNDIADMPRYLVDYAESKKWD